MKKDANKQDAAPVVFVIPEQAHFELVQIREHLRLMARLSEPGTAASLHDVMLKPHALSWWFSRLGRDIGKVIKAAYWSPAHQPR